MTRIRLTLRLLAVTILFPAPGVPAQLAHTGPAEAIARAATLPPFDIVSVKQNNSGDGNSNMTTRDVQVIATNVSLEFLLEFAYDIKSDLISGLSGPVASAHFDIDAKVLPADSGAPAKKFTDAQLQAMLLPLLADRFHFKAHVLPKILPVYDLVALHGVPTCKLSQEERKDTGMNMNRSNNDVTLTAKGVSMADLADALSDSVHRRVIDRTGVKGSCDITLKWTTDEAADADSQVLSVFTALQEQLGLKLQSAKGPVETLVIDHVEMPSQN